MEDVRSDVGQPVVSEVERAQVGERREHTCRQVCDLIYSMEFHVGKNV